METALLEFSKLTTRQLYDLLALRQKVFIIEQNCPYDDIDGYDQKALHLLFYSGKNLAAYIRIFPPNIKFKESALGRIVVAKNFRGTGLGKELITKGIEVTFQKFEKSPIRIEAQAKLEDYYTTYGFKAEGKTYSVDGINHIQMVLEAPK